jgi:acyl-CoA synthetase (AMP-forming)/AMP-acid ligase II
VSAPRRIFRDAASGLDGPFDTSRLDVGADGVRSYQGKPATLTEMLRLTVERDPGQEAVVELGGPRLTYRQLWDAAATVAGGLRAQGVRPGDRVAIRLPNGADWAVAFYGVQLAGAVAVPVNTRFSPDEVGYVVGDSGARVVLEPGSPLPAGAPLADDSRGADDLAGIFYTSGTTGFPKGAMTTNANFVANSETVQRVRGIDLGAETRNLISVPMFHVTGCNTQLVGTVDNGGTVVVMPRFEVHEFISAIVAERINTLVSVPAIYWLALQQPDLSTVDVEAIKLIGYGGAPIAPSLVLALMDRFPQARLANGFGLTETSSITTNLPHEYADKNADSVGFAVPVIDLKVADPDPATGVGELLVRGPNVVPGYWNKPEATAATFVDGWLHTGDVAWIDGQGLVRIVDRIKDMINRGGENVYSVEVENALAAAPGVYEVAVVGVPDQMMGEKVGAVLVPLPGSRLDPAAVIGYAREHLADFKVPQYLALRDEPLPRNPAGKILKAPLRSGADWQEAPRPGR